MSLDPGYVYTVHAAFNPAHIQLSTDGVYLALPLKQNTVGVWNLQEMSQQVSKTQYH